MTPFDNGSLCAGSSVISRYRAIDLTVPNKIIIKRGPDRNVSSRRTVVLPARSSRRTAAYKRLRNCKALCKPRVSHGQAPVMGGRRGPGGGREEPRMQPKRHGPRGGRATSTGKDTFMSKFDLSRRQFIGAFGATAALAGLAACNGSTEPAAEGTEGEGTEGAALVGSISCSGATSFQPLVEKARDGLPGRQPRRLRRHLRRRLRPGPLPGRRGLRPDRPLRRLRRGEARGRPARGPG